MVIPPNELIVPVLYRLDLPSIIALHACSKWLREIVDGGKRLWRRIANHLWPASDHAAFGAFHDALVCTRCKNPPHPRLLILARLKLDRRWQDGLKLGQPPDFTIEFTDSANDDWTEWIELSVAGPLIVHPTQANPVIVSQPEPSAYSVIQSGDSEWAAKAEPIRHLSMHARRGVGDTTCASSFAANRAGNDYEFHDLGPPKARITWLDGARRLFTTFDHIYDYPETDLLGRQRTHRHRVHMNPRRSNSDGPHMHHRHSGGLVAGGRRGDNDGW